MNQAPSLAPSHAVLSPPEVRLLLLLSRPALSAAQQERARELVLQVGDWRALIDTAWRKYVLSMVYQNLARLEEGGPADDVFAMMRPQALFMTSEMLRRHAAFDWFHERCVLASGVPHAYFKGRALAARFYPDPVQRFYRDIDILVPRAARADLIRCMIDQGCRVLLKRDSGHEEIVFATDAQLDEFLFMTPVPGVVTPQELMVELHGEIDQQTSLFRTSDLLRGAREVSTQNHRIRVLPDAPHVAFICYHHTRHVWSKLNWVADLAAICTHPEFDREAVLDHARGLKIATTVAAAFEFHDLTSAGYHPTDFDRTTPGIDLLGACVTGLAGDDDLEARMREDQVLSVLSFSWQDVPVSRRRLAVLGLRKFRPVYADFRTMPGGRWLRYALATGLRLQQFASRRLTRALRR